MDFSSLRTQGTMTNPAFLSFDYDVQKNMHICPLHICLMRSDNSDMSDLSPLHQRQMNHAQAPLLAV